MGCYTGEVGILGFLILYPVIPTSGTWIRRVSNISDHFILTGKSVIISNNQFKHIYSLNQVIDFGYDAICICNCKSNRTG